MHNLTEILDQHAIHRALTRISYEIVERNHGCTDIVLAGIRTRGVPMAARIADKICEVEGRWPPVFEINPAPYRDDRDACAIDLHPADESMFSGKTVILIDDVLFTGRTVRAALTAVFRCGRPAKVQLAVLIDRGHRELPIRPDYIGKNVPTALSERVQVRLMETDGTESVCIMKQA